MTRLYLLAGGKPVHHRCVVDVEAELAGTKDGNAAFSPPRRRGRPWLQSGTTARLCPTRSHGLRVPLAPFFVQVAAVAVVDDDRREVLDLQARHRLGADLRPGDHFVAD